MKVTDYKIVDKYNWFTELIQRFKNAVRVFKAERVVILEVELNEEANQITKIGSMNLAGLFSGICKSQEDTNPK